MDMISANSRIILALETNRNDRLWIVRVVMGFVEVSAFDLGLFHIRVLDDIYELIFSKVQGTLITYLAFLLFTEIFSAWRSVGFEK